MSIRQVIAVALDVLREAVASKYLVFLFGSVTLGLVGLSLALDIEVVDGAIAAGRLFGGTLDGAARGMKSAAFLAPVMQAMAYVTFYVGLGFMILAVADLAPRWLAPGRVELLLSLPVRRAELVLGIYVGVLIIAAAAGGLAVGGGSLVLFFKVELFTPAPFFGAVGAFIAFMTLYAVMLLVTTLVRSASLAAVAALLLFVVGVVTSDRQLVTSLLRGELLRKAAAIAMGPLPRLRALADIGADGVLRGAIDWSQAWPVAGGCLAFGACALVAACAVVHVKDY
jgi:Cu-processing system permease protein